MKNPVIVNIAAEDSLSEATARKIIEQYGKNLRIGASFVRGGSSYLKKAIQGFNRAAKITPFFVLTDLDRNRCAPMLKREWLDDPSHPNLIFRVAVREIESWLLADRSSFAAFLKIEVRRIPTDPDGLADPKQTLLDLTKLSPKRDVRNDIVPPRDSSRPFGPNYNSRLIAYVIKKWDPEIAQVYSDSLRRTISRITNFKKV